MASERALITCEGFERALTFVSEVKWRSVFSEVVVKYVAEQPEGIVYALAAIWHRGALDLYKLVTRVGDVFCEIDAAYARGEPPRRSKWTVTRMIIVREFIP